MRFTLTNQHGVLVGTTKTVHVCIDTVTSGKVPLPEAMRSAFAAHAS
jgi:acyl-CoA thioesterase FadM